MSSSVAYLTVEENHTIREFIRIFKLWWEEDEPPTRMSPVLRMRGWDITHRPDIAPLIAISTRRGSRKILTMRDDAPLSVQASMIAHTLAHDLLGHAFEMDSCVPPRTRHLIPNRGVLPAHDDAANAAAALMLIPDRFALSSLSVREIVSWCGVPTHVVMRRLTGTRIVEDIPPTILRIDRRGPGESWQHDPDALSIIGGG